MQKNSKLFSSCFTPLLMAVACLATTWGFADYASATEIHIQCEGNRFEGTRMPVQLSFIYRELDIGILPIGVDAQAPHGIRSLRMATGPRGEMMLRNEIFNSPGLIGPEENAGLAGLAGFEKYLVPDSDRGYFVMIPKNLPVGTFSAFVNHADPSINTRTSFKCHMVLGD